MNQQEKRIKIAEACGWKNNGVGFFHKDGMVRTVTGIPSGDDNDCGCDPLPNYFNDLNACSEMERVLDALPPNDRSMWLDRLALESDWPEAITAADLRFEVQYLCVRAAAAQRAEAFGKTLNLW